MPFYDYIYNTMDSSTDELYERTLKGTEETPDLVHLTHMTNLRSTYHLRVGIASIASRPSESPEYPSNENPGDDAERPCLYFKLQIVYSSISVPVPCCRPEYFSVFT
uniref:Uncharacterized protein n=1 Tax=Aegilops tauschii subsp. strangulata TaxID=200361 RepID=A0A453CII3_AEGTS